MNFNPDCFNVFSERSNVPRDRGCRRHPDPTDPPFRPRELRDHLHPPQELPVSTKASGRRRIHENGIDFRRKVSQGAAIVQRHAADLRRIEKSSTCVRCFPILLKFVFFFPLSFS